MCRVREFAVEVNFKHPDPLRTPGYISPRRARAACAGAGDCRGSCCWRARRCCARGFARRRATTAAPHARPRAGTMRCRAARRATTGTPPTATGARARARSRRASCASTRTARVTRARRPACCTRGT